MLIRNEYLEASFKAKGAELCSLKALDTGLEYIWQADAAHWGRHAPVLFPIVGALKDGQFQFAGKQYPLSRHGFARNAEFVVDEQGADHITFLLASSEATLEVYPFPFELRITYTLAGKKLTVGYDVCNTADAEMYFSIGGHPAFNCPMAGDGSKFDYRFIYSEEEQADAHWLVNDLFSGETTRVLEGQELPIGPDTFAKDALVFKGLKSGSVTLASSQREWLRFHFAGFPYLGLWSASAEAPFVCIEPWYGIADNFNHNGDWTQKEGIQKLEGGTSFSCAYGIEVL